MARRAPWPRSQRALVAALVLAVASLAAALGAWTARGTASATAALEGQVVRIVDGDTIHVQVGDRIEKVRYIGVNTPEVHHPRKGVERGGRDAVRVNRDLVGGRTVRLELDVQERDRYGRLLAYVWVGGVMINEEMVRLGYAQVMTVPPNVRYQQRFLSREREARESGRGLWG